MLAFNIKFQFVVAVHLNHKNRNNTLSSATEIRSAPDPSQCLHWQRESLGVQVLAELIKRYLKEGCRTL